MRIRLVAILAKEVEVNPKNYDGSVIWTKQQELEALLKDTPAEFVKYFDESEISVWEVR